MKFRIVTALALALAALLSPIRGIAAKNPQRDWKRGTLLDTARLQRGGGGAVAISQSSGASSNPYAEAAGNAANAAMLAAASIPDTVQQLSIEGGGYLYTVRRVVGRKNPNLTVNGPIEYAVEKNRFFIRDEDGVEFELTVVEKAVPPAAGSRSLATGWPALAHQYAPNVPGDQLDSVVAELRARYPDIDKVLPLLNITAATLTPRPEQITLAEYLESLYVIVMHASFAEKGRAAILSDPLVAK